MRYDKIMSRKAFEAWLRGKKSSEVIGERKTGWSCPLATFLQGQGYAAPYVSGWYYRPDTLAEGSTPTGRNMPEWAERFVTAVDWGYQARGDEAAEAVTAAEARRILRRR